jgi:hypothetical protein
METYKVLYEDKEKDIVIVKMSSKAWIMAEGEIRC